MSALLGPNGQPLPEGIGRAIASMSTGRGGELTYRAGSAREQALSGWSPAQTSADGAWLWNRDLAVSRTRDLLATEPWAQGAVDRKLDMVVGAGWRPSINPHAEALGISLEEAANLGNQIESAYHQWADDPLCRCDAEETLNGSWLLHLQVMEHEVTGDGVSVLRWRERPDWGFRTALSVVDSDRLCNPNLKSDTDLLRGGVEFDPTWGAPSAYHFRNAHPGDLGMGVSQRAFTWERVERREPWGRPRVLHLFGKNRPGMSRGVSKLVSGLARFKQMQRFAEGELANAVINALFAATITSSFDPAVAQDHLTASATQGYHELRNAYYDTTSPLLGGARIQHLFPGDELKFLTSPRETAGFESFFAVFLRSIASGLGIAYEQVAMDWSKVNYSSARAALIEVWRGIQKTRSMVAMMVATPLLLAVTEDAIDQGIIEVPANAPDLYEAPAAWLRGRWIGPARGWVDPVKEPAGALMAIEGGFSNWADAAAEQGVDFDMNLAALRAQKDKWQESGLTPPSLAAMLAVSTATGEGARESSAAA